MQTAFVATPVVALEGGIATGVPIEIITRSAFAAIRFGAFVVKVIDNNTNVCAQPTAAAADVDSIILTGISAVGIQVYVPGGGAGLDFDGAGIGGTDGIIEPVARNVTLTQNAHADWDATASVVAGLDENGKEVTETLTTIADAGGTVTGTQLFSKIQSYTVPAQTGGNGTFTLGVGTMLGPCNGRTTFGVATAQTGLGADTPAVGYAANDTVSILRKGQVYVLAEQAVEIGDPVYVRFVVAGAEVLGRMGNIADGTAITAPDCSRLSGAYFKTRTTAVNQLALIELDLPSGN